MSRHGDNIRKRADGRWEGRYRYRNPDGSYKYKSVYGKTCREVKERITNAMLNLNQNPSDMENRGQAEALLFGTIAEAWLYYIRAHRKYSTYLKYHTLYESYLKENMEKIQLSAITNQLVNEKVFRREEAKMSEDLKHGILALINQILRYAGKNHTCQVSLLTNQSVKERNRKLDIINHSDQARLIRFLYQEMDTSKAGILLCIFTGLRLGEICSLEWQDIDFEQMLIHVNQTVQRLAVRKEKPRTELVITPPKSVFSIREIPITETARLILRRIAVRGEYVLGGDRPMEPRTYQNHFKKYLQELNLNKYNFHALRHTFATNCIDQGMDVKSLSEILGHSDVQITLNRYVHPTMDTKRRHIAALDTVYGQYCGQEDKIV